MVSEAPLSVDDHNLSKAFYHTETKNIATARGKEIRKVGQGGELPGSNVSYKPEENKEIEKGEFMVTGSVGTRAENPSGGNLK